MANDHYHPHDRRYGSSTTINSLPHQRDEHGHDHDHRHQRARKHQKPNPPPVPQPPTPGTMQAPPARVPASHVGRHEAHAEPVPIPIVDPEAMPAKRGLNEWGAFTGGVPPGSGPASGTFGFGPLLFRAVGERAGGRDRVEGSLPEPVGHAVRETDLFEMDRLLQNDPISFNPMRAISWANLDDEPVRERSPDPAIETERQRTGSRELMPATERGDRVSAKPRCGKRKQQEDDEHANKQAKPSSDCAEPRNKKRVSHSVSRVSDHTEPSPSPVGTMSKTFSAVSLRTPDLTDGRSTFVPPPAPRALNSHPSPIAEPSQQLLNRTGQHDQRQQRKYRHRNGIKNSPPNPGPSPVLSEVYHQQQVYQPPPMLPPSALPMSMPPPQPNFRLAQQVCPYSTYQVSPTPYTTAAALPPPPAQLPDVFLCLGPYCSARFPTEAELNAHYRAEHSLACSWATCGAAGFTSNNALVWHVKAEHLLLCPLPGCCDRVFASKRALDGHVRVS